jgi:hypothetical protein
MIQTVILTRNMQTTPTYASRFREIHVRSLIVHQIADPNERRRLALAEIDKAPFGWCMIPTNNETNQESLTGNKTMCAL